MKRWGLGILVVLLLLAAGCGSNAGGDGTFSEQDLAIRIGDRQFKVGEPVDGLLSALGGDFEYFEQQNPSYDGLDKSYEYETVQIHTVPFEGKDLIAEIYLFGGALQTAKNIGIGSTRAEVEAAYGTGYVKEESEMAYWAGKKGDANSPCLGFFLDAKDVVSELVIVGKPLE